jgi:hypothetical protein
MIRAGCKESVKLLFELKTWTRAGRRERMQKLDPKLVGHRKDKWRTGLCHQSLRYLKIREPELGRCRPVVGYWRRSVATLVEVNSAQHHSPTCNSEQIPDK